MHIHATDTHRCVGLLLHNRHWCYNYKCMQHGFTQHARSQMAVAESRNMLLQAIAAELIANPQCENRESSRPACLLSNLSMELLCTTAYACLFCCSSDNAQPPRPKSGTAQPHNEGPVPKVGVYNGWRHGINSIKARTTEETDYVLSSRASSCCPNLYSKSQTTRGFSLLLLRGLRQHRLVKKLQLAPFIVRLPRVTAMSRDQTAY